MSTKYTTADDSSDLGWVQTGRTFFRYGWSVGKKVAIAGVAISVAPLAIPLIMVFSALGLALSIPFGIFYVGMVGVEKLMQSLLPLGQGQEVRQGDEIVEEGKGYLDEREFEENLERERDDEYEEVLDEIVEEGKVYGGKRDPKPEENGKEGEDDDAIVEIPGERDTVTEEYGESNNNNVVVESFDEKAEEKDYNVVVETSNEMVSGVEETGGLEKADDDAIVEISVEMDAGGKEHSEVNKNGGVESLNVSKKGFKPERENEGMKKDGAKGDADNNGIAVEGKTNGNNGTVDKRMEREGPLEVQVETGNTDIVEEKEMVTTGTDSKVSKKGENELSAVSSEGDDVSEVRGKSDLADAETQPSAEHADEVKDINALASVSAESTVTPDVEVN